MLTQAIHADNSQSQTKTKRKPRRSAVRPTLDPCRIYTRKEAAFALGCSELTLIRARDAGHLSEFRCGNRCKYSGQQLLDWLNAGGRTS